MGISRRSIGVKSLLAAIVALISTAIPASASAAPAATAPAVVSDSGFGPDRPIVYEFGACGTVIDVLGDPATNQRQVRTIAYANGAVVVSRRGQEQVTLRDTNTEDTVVGKTISLTVTGTNTKYTSPSGVISSVQTGSSLFFPNSEGERNAFTASHLPGLIWIKSGLFAQYTSPSGATTHLLAKPARPTSVCEQMGLGAYKNFPVLAYEVDGG